MKKLNNQESILYNKNPGENLDNKVFSYDRRICFTKLDDDGLDDMYEYSRMPEFYKHLTGLNPHKYKGDTRKYLKILMGRINSGYYEGRAMYWFLRLRTSNKVIGTFGLVGIDFDKQTAIMGKGLSPKYWGKGLMFETIWIALKYCFEELDLHTINTITYKNNLPNITIMKVCGARDPLKNELIKLNDPPTGYRILTLKKSEVNLNKCLAFAKIGAV